MDKVSPDTKFYASGVAGGLLILLLFRRWLQGPTKGTDIKKRLDGLVAVVTGCNTGIGKVTAHELSKRGAKVIMLCRNLHLAKIAADQIRKATKNEVVIKKLDLSSLKSVRECAKDLLESEEKIDYLINNAGVMMCPEWKTEDGYEMQFGTNHLGHFLLTELLMPLLKESAATGHKARIIIVSSMGHERGKMNWPDINYTLPGSYDPVTAYQQSKLANVLHGAELARRLQGTGISVYSLHPGVINTELSRHIRDSSPILYCVLFLLSPLIIFLIKTPFYGAQTTLYCTLDDSIGGRSGRYYSDCAEMLPAPQARIVEDQKRLWRISQEFVNKVKLP